MAELTSFRQQKKEGLPHAPKWSMKQTLLVISCSDDFSDSMNNTEQKPDDQGKSSDKTADDNI